MVLRDDKEVEEIYEHVQQDVQSTKKKERSWLNRLKPEVKLGGLACLGFGIWYITSNKVPLSKVWPWALFLAVAIYILSQDNPEPRKLTEAETAASLYSKIKEMQKVKFGERSRMPEGRIDVSLVGKEQWLRGVPWKRHHAFTITDLNNIPKHYSGEMNIWDGEPIAIKERPTRFTGHEARDMEMIPPKELKWEAEREKYLERYKGKVR